MGICGPLSVTYLPTYPSKGSEVNKHHTGPIIGIDRLLYDCDSCP